MSLPGSLTYFISSLLFLRFGRRICHAIIMILVGITFLMFLLVYKGKRFEQMCFRLSGIKLTVVHRHFANAALTLNR